MMLQGFVQSIETVVDQQLSWRSLRWRLEAWRTGRSFAEIAFVHTLLFRVEHVFLLHRESGVQLLHATRPGVIAREPDVIAAMLSAIQDFLRDAFDTPETDSATSFAINELAVIVENGNHAAIAAVVRGQPRAEIRMQLREAVERIETGMAGSLTGFDGDTAPFEAARPQVEACLTESARARDRGAASKRSPIVPFALITMAVGLLTWWIIGAVVAAAQHARFEEFVAMLRDEPGYVITAEEIGPERVSVRGLRDPHARGFDELARRHGLEDLAEAHLRPFHSLHEPFVAQRVERALQPPDGVRVAMQDGTLRVTGEASHRWLALVRAIAVAIDGVHAVDVSGCRDRDALAFDRAAAALHALDPRITELADPGGAARGALAAALRELVALGVRADRPWRLRAEFVWWSADDASESARQARALVAELTRQFGVPITLDRYVDDQSVTDATLRLTVQSP
ncbi:MAG: hypothetical protein KAI24_12900, partial [Planctomycetes bacterium]|nr:hypothetical protein [Planctomycetota bacterium]